MVRETFLSLQPFQMNCIDYRNHCLKLINHGTFWIVSKLLFNGHYFLPNPTSIVAFRFHFQDELNRWCDWMYFWFYLCISYFLLNSTRTLKDFFKESHIYKCRMVFKLTEYFDNEWFLWWFLAIYGSGTYQLLFYL